MALEGMHSDSYLTNIIDLVWHMWKTIPKYCTLSHTHSHTYAHILWKTYVIWSFQRCTTSQVQHNDWEKWFQTLVVTALITYSALSPFLLSLALPSSLPLFSSVSYWLHSMARHLSRCHPPYGFLFPSLCVKQWKQYFSVQSFFPLLFRLLTPPLLLLLTFATDSSLFQAYWKGKLVHVVLMIPCSCVWKQHKGDKSGYKLHNGDMCTAYRAFYWCAYAFKRECMKWMYIDVFSLWG